MAINLESLIINLKCFKKILTKINNSKEMKTRQIWDNFGWLKSWCSPGLTIPPPPPINHWYKTLPMAISKIYCINSATLLLWSTNKKMHTVNIYVYASNPKQSFQMTKHSNKVKWVNNWVKQ